MAREDLSYIYETSPYSWSGEDRPILSDYIGPWNYVASMTPSKWDTKYGNARNSAITYAQNMMQNAISQYNSDVDYWNERDSRSYNTPASQSERYENAGFNMGYMYGSVSSGNTQSGYSSPDASSDVQKTEAPESLVSEIVLPMINTLGSLASQGVDIWREVKDIGRIDQQTKLYYAQTAESLSRGRKASAEATLTEAQKEWYLFLRNYTPDGQPVENAYGLDAHQEQSLAFLAESLNYDIDSAEYKDLQTWLSYCEKAYQNDTTQPMKDVFQDIDSSDMPDAVKTTLKVLAYWATSGGVGVRTNVKR